MYGLGPSNGSLMISTGRAGLAARAGHDLVIEVGRWNAELSFEPDAPERTYLRATADATSLTVREGLGGAKPLTDADRAQIQQTIADKILRTNRHPEITFVSTSAQADRDGVLSVTGDLTIAGVGVTVQLPISMQAGDDGTVLTTSVAIMQSRFGIKPFSALMGSLKVADTVEIRASAKVPQVEPVAER